MGSFQLDQALGRYVVVDPAEKSSVLRAEEIATVFKVISIGCSCEGFGFSDVKLAVDALVIVYPGTVQKVMMGHKEVYFVRDSDIIAKVKSGNLTS